jgi:hypothetical protein
MPYKKLLCTALAFTPLLASAERAEFGYLGVGLESVAYEETSQIPDNGDNSNPITGATLKTDYSGNSFAQRSGAYSPINEDWGYYITSISTLGSKVHTEDWKFDGVTYQSNSMTINQGDLEILSTYRLSDHHYVLFGGVYQRFDYNRFAHALSDEAIALNTSRREAAEANGETVVIDSSGCADWDAICTSVGSVSEEITTFLIEAGYEYNEFFEGSDLGWKQQYQFVAGLPAYNRGLNTLYPDNVWSETFAGFAFRASANLGYQFSKHFLISASLDYRYQKRDEIEIEIQPGVVAEIPDNTLSYIQPSLNAYWSF